MLPASFLQAAARPSLPDGYVWIREEEFDDYAKPRLVERLADLLPE